MANDSITPENQLKANDLLEKIDNITRENPNLINDKTIIDSLSKIHKSSIETNELQNINNSIENTNNTDNYNLPLGINDNLINQSVTELKKDKKLSRDQMDSCGAILCSYSLTKPSECTSYLGICPIDKITDSILTSLAQNVLPYQKDTGCTADDLNKRTHKTIRTTNKMPRYCKILSENAYTDIAFSKYKCDRKSYKKIDWNRGYSSIQITSKKTQIEYQKSN